MSEEKRAKIISMIRDTIREAEPNAQIILYGSVARGDDTEESDIDILIISDHQKEIQDKITSESFKIVLNNQEVINPIIMSTDRINKINDFTFMKNIRRDGIVIG